MIELTIATAAMLYLCLTLSVLLGLWGYTHYSSRTKKVIVIEKELHVCEYCHCAYVFDIAKEITRCPQCQCLNKRH